MEYFDPIKHRSEVDFVKTNPSRYDHLYQDESIFPFWIADMDFKVAPCIRESIKKLGDRGVFAYEYNMSKLYGAVSGWFQRRHQLDLNPKCFVQVNGVLTGIALLIRLYSNTRDGVIINSPVYHMFAHTIRSNKRKVIDNPLCLDTETGEFSFDFEDLERKMSEENNKIFLLCNPHNPVGKVWAKEQLQRIKELANKHDVLVISDEVHADILYNGNRFTSYKSIDPENSIILLGSPAKTFGMQSVATGHIYTENQSFFRKVRMEAEAMFLHHGNALTYYMTIAAYNKGDSWLDELLSYLQITIDEISSFLENYLPEVKMISPEGTYQIWMDFSACNLTEEELKNWIFNQAKMGMAPGTQFGESYSKWFRINIATDRHVILNYLNRLYQTKPKL